MAVAVAKQCSKCGELKAPEDFHGRRANCKDCHRAQMRAYYERERAAGRRRPVVYRRKWAEIREAIREAKAVACADCGIRYPSRVMHFHHIGPKRFTISQAARKGATLEEVQDELKQCVVLCANCHAIRHVPEGEIEP